MALFASFLQLPPPANNYLKHSCQCASALLLVLVFVSGCTTMPAETGPISPTPGADDILEFIQRENSDVTTFKASGRITVWRNDEFLFNQSALWAGQRPDRLRLTIMGIDGRPQVSMVSDGDWLEVLLHSEGRMEKLAIRDNGLQRLAGITLPPKDLGDLLVGRIPLVDHRRAAIRPAPAPEHGFILELKGRWGKIRQRLYYTRPEMQVYRLEVFSGWGRLRYRAELEPPRQAEGFRFFPRLEISDGHQDLLKIETRRFWPNTPLPDGIFRLSPPQAAVRRSQ